MAEIFYLQFKPEFIGKTFGKGRKITSEPFEETNLEMAMTAIESDMAEQVEKPKPKEIPKPKSSKKESEGDS